jgi:RNA polymerase sigma factor (sigma-70 family)
VKPESPQHFLNLAVMHIRLALLDLAKKYFGLEGVGAHHSTDKASPSGDDHPRYEKADSTDDPRKTFNWVLFHEETERLPEREREVFGLRWYRGLKLVEIARLQGTSTETAERAWRSARKLLRKAMEDKSPAP